MAVEWTDRQLKAINSRAGEFIVSASAGTGKTSVIIERAWRLVNTQRANVDELLIVTFTNDAAEQLKTRFRSKLQQELVKASESDRRSYLLDQLHRLDRTQISTIHAFCMKIIRQNYQLLGISDDVDVVSPERVKLFKHRIIEELFEASYSEQGEFGSHFRQLVQKYGGSKVDYNLQQIIISLHNFLSTQAWPEHWLERVKQFSEQLRSKDLQITSLEPWKIIKSNWQRFLADANKQFQQLSLQAAKHNNQKLQNYLTDLTQISDRQITLLENDQVQDLLTAIEQKLPSSPRITSKSPDLGWWDSIHKQVDSIKDKLKKFYPELISALSSTDRETLAEQSEIIDTILELEHRFSRNFANAKEDEGGLEFDDQQRLALKLLADRTPSQGESAKPSALAKKYRDQFKFVMVDEYQDVNELQDTIIRLVSRDSNNGADGNGNLFMVGDVKQSIYKFRQAEPEIFQRLCKLAASESHKGINRIDLPENFRSRNEIIDAVNRIFRSILTGGQLELEYDKANELVYRSNYPPANGNRTTELHILERKINSQEIDDDDNDILIRESIEREAYLTARRIKGLLDSKLPIYHEGQLRPVEPEDIVILLRSLKNTAGVYISMLRRMGLVGNCQQVEAFLEYPEIADVLALLRIIDNPFRDIDLATVLRSPLVGAGAEELARIRLSQNGYLFNALRAFVAGNKNDSAGDKFSQFLVRLESWRRTAGCCSVGELVQEIFLQTSYPDHAGLGGTDTHSRENLDQFLQLAWQLSEDDRSDLRNFLDYLNLLAERNESISTIQAGTGRGVKLMSVHASKGLEFPVVVLGNIGKKVNFIDIRKDILLDRHLLVGIRNIDPEKLSKTKAIFYQAISQSSRDKTIAEELRLLYVAMTRAKEKLILIGSAAIKKLITGISDIAPGEKVEPGIVSKLDTPLGWLAAGIACDSGSQKFFSDLLQTDRQASIDIPSLQLTVYPPTAQMEWGLEDRLKEDEGNMRKLLGGIVSGKTGPDEKSSPEFDEIIERINWRYPYKEFCSMPAKFSVTELTKRAGGLDDARDLQDQPAMIVGGEIHWPEDTGEQAKKRGLAWHKLLECIDLNAPAERDCWTGQIKTLIEKNILTAEQAEMIDLQQMENFFASRPGKIMLAYPSKVRRELAFTFSMESHSLTDDVSLGDTDEPAVIQGIVDCLVDTPDGIVIIDYKTNRIDSSQVDQKAQYYKTQIELYTRAFSEILKRRAASAWLYFTVPDSAVQII